MHFPLSRVLALTLIAGCSGDIASDGDARSISVPTPGMNPVAGSGATLPGAGTTPGSAGTGAAAPTGASASASTTLNLAGAPQYSRFVRLTNSQWARSVQDILNLRVPRGSTRTFRRPVAARRTSRTTSSCSTSTSAPGRRFQSAAETLADAGHGLGRALAKRLHRHRRGGLHRRPRAARVPPTAQRRRGAAYTALFDDGRDVSGAGARSPKARRS